MKRGASGYHGVGARGDLWFARIRIHGRLVDVGVFDTREDAALAYDRVARWLRGAHELNFPKRSLEPASVEEMRARARRLALERIRLAGPSAAKSRWRHHPRADSGYWGVVPDDDGHYVAHLYVERRARRAGVWATAYEAAIARDRAVLHLGLDWPLNDAEAARKAGPMSLQDLQRISLMDRSRKQKGCAYLGVSWDRRTQKWAATVNMPDVSHFVGRYTLAEDAALAFDRAVLMLRGAEAMRNFPSRRLAPATPKDLRAEAHKAYKETTTSRYHGVSYEPKHLTKPWCAMAPGHVAVGFWENEREAALAVDRAVLHLGLDARLNLPAQARKKGPASPEALRDEAHAQFKKKTSSGYRGVHWSKRDKVWVAMIGHRGKHWTIGSFPDEVAAAEAYDTAARKHHGAKAKLNFPP